METSLCDLYQDINNQRDRRVVLTVWLLWSAHECYYCVNTCTNELL